MTALCRRHGTNIGLGDSNGLYLNDGHGNLRLSEAEFTTPVDRPSKGHAWGDVDLDGDLDVAIASGTNGTEHIHNELWLNDGNAKFSAVVGEEFVTDSHISAGIAAAVAFRCPRAGGRRGRAL